MIPQIISGMQPSLLLPRVSRFFRHYRPGYIPIAYKLAFVMSILITTGMVILGLTIVSKQTHLLQNQIHSFGLTSASLLGESSKELILSDDLLGLMVVTRNFANNGDILGSAVYSEKGEQLTMSGRIPMEYIVQSYLHSSHTEDEKYSVEWQDLSSEGRVIDMISFLTPIYFDNIITGHALVAFSKETMDQALEDTAKTILVSTIVMVLMSIVVALIAGKRLSRPINKLMDASVAVGNGEYSHHIKDRRNDEIGILSQAFNRMTTDLLEKSQVESAFSCFVSNTVAKQIMSNLKNIELGGKHVDGTVLFADIVGFTGFSENLPPHEVLDMLNEYFTYISTATSLYKGTIDKYMGDCAMVIFGVPEADSDHKFHALLCAVMIQKLMVRLNDIRISDGKPTIHFRIGINSGCMLAGNIGSMERMQYTVVGDTVNLASRLQTMAKKDQIIITDQLYHDKDLEGRLMAREFELVKLRGISEDVATYIVEDVAPDYRAQINAQIDDILQRQSGTSVR